MAVWGLQACSVAKLSSANLQACSQRLQTQLVSSSLHLLRSFCSPRRPVADCFQSPNWNELIIHIFSSANISAPPGWCCKVWKTKAQAITSDPLTLTSCPPHLNFYSERSSRFVLTCPPPWGPDPGRVPPPSRGTCSWPSPPGRGAGPAPLCTGTRTKVSSQSPPTVESLIKVKQKLTILKQTPVATETNGHKESHMFRALQVNTFNSNVWWKRWRRFFWQLHQQKSWIWVGLAKCSDGVWVQSSYFLSTVFWLTSTVITVTKVCFDLSFLSSFLFPMFLL